MEPAPISAIPVPSRASTRVPDITETTSTDRVSGNLSPFPFTADLIENVKSCDIKYLLVWTVRTVTVTVKATDICCGRVGGCHLKYSA